MWSSMWDWPGLIRNLVIKAWMKIRRFSRHFLKSTFDHLWKQHEIKKPTEFVVHAVTPGVEYKPRNPVTGSEDFSDHQTYCLHECEPLREHMKASDSFHLQRAKEDLFIPPSLSPAAFLEPHEDGGGEQPEVSLQPSFYSLASLNSVTVLQPSEHCYWSDPEKNPTFEKPDSLSS